MNFQCVINDQLVNWGCYWCSALPWQTFYIFWHGIAGIYEVPWKYTHTLYLFVYKGQDYLVYFSNAEVDKD